MRQNPIILKYRERIDIDYNFEDTDNQYLLFIGGNNIAEYKRQNTSLTA